MNLEGRLGKSFAELPATSGCPRCPERDGGRPEGPFYEINALFQNGSEAAVSSVDGGSWEPRLPPQVHQPQLQRFHQSNPGAAGHYDNSTSTRKVCVQAWLYRTFGYDHIADFFVPGCDTPALWDFDRWAAVSGCGYHNDRSVHVGPLQIHTAWIGPVDGIFTELIALVDSFLATQHTVGGRAILTLWFLEDDPPSLDHPLRRRFVLHDGHAVRFERADLAALAAGTCLEGRREYLDVNVSGVDWKRAGTMGPKEKADMARILLLHAHGGVWVDTDSVLLRDLEPLVRFIGPDFATKITLSPLYNNNVLALRRRGDVARRMLEFVCETPFTPAGRRAYCSVVGTPCYPKWYWNHGVIQMAVRNGVSLVVVPWSYTDPAYPCFPQMLFSAAGAKPAPNLVIEDSLEMIRGAFVLHTRGYNAKKPLSNHSGFAKLYALAARRAASRPAPRGGPGSHLYRALGPRDVAEEAHFRRLLAPRGPNVVEPTFLPWHGPNSTYSIETARFPRMCLAASRARSIGDHPVVAVADCTTARSSDQELGIGGFKARPLASIQLMVTLGTCDLISPATLAAGCGVEYCASQGCRGTLKTSGPGRLLYRRAHPTAQANAGSSTAPPIRFATLVLSACACRPLIVHCYWMDGRRKQQSPERAT
eukprot:CAMPEP_0206296834 /NCGR_PEP_ID=MMETSP0106_2-20121207/5869_1 /ASSEMBLY_ACC=CAM_ASM_000206 /TAXON_ID=81532 /ORGANISM="Acanthoeca-like sp., Strain 10tr" /LENGTH=648 /DNA_ID=CAMNT_0053727497 /DNA_START=214 /DNA_END=2161 /DNA_ORIENTATION=-